MLEGEAGVGKTSVLRSLSANAGAEVRVIWGACDALATPRALGPLVDMAARGAVETAERLAAGSPPHEAFDAFLRDLSKPTLAIMEDLHWADEATLDMLRFVGRRIDRTPSVIVASMRADEVGTDHPLRLVLGDLATSGMVRREILPLSSSAVRQLAAGSEIDADELHRVTGGNPFYVTEVLAHPGTAVPTSVRDAVLSRVRRLSQPVRDLLESVSVEPGAVERRLLRSLDLDGRAVDDALRGGVLVDDGTGLRFRHELARLVLAESIPADRLAEVHRRLLAAMERLPGADPARLAHHAARTGDEPAQLRWSTVAARQAARASAHREAAAHYGRAAQHVGLLAPADAADLLTGYTEALHAIDRPGQAVETWEQIIPLREAAGDRVGAWVARAQLARAMWTAGRSEEAYALIDEAVGALADEAQDGRVADAFAVGGYLAMLARRTEDAIAWSHRAIEIATLTGHRSALPNALNALGSARIVGLEDLGGLADLQQSGAIAEELGQPRSVANMYSNAGSALGEIRRYEQAVTQLEAANAYADAHDMDFFRRYSVAWLARVRFEQGRWDEADALATEAIGEGHGSPISPMVALVVRGRVRARRGLAGTAEPLDAAWQTALRAGDLQRTWPAVVARAEAAWLEGSDVARVIADLQPILEDARRRGMAWSIGELAFWLARLSGGAVDPAGAAPPFAASLRGDHGQAAAAWARLGCPYEEAWARADAGDPANLRYALDLLMRLGAQPLATRVRRRLRDLGAAGIPRGPRATTAEGPSGLTVREREVVELLATGLTDREIAEWLVVSPRTVSHHVSAILRKLDVRRRADAAAAARELGLASEPTKMGRGRPQSG